MEDITIMRAGMYFVSTISIDRSYGMEKRAKEQYVIEVSSFTAAEEKTFAMAAPCDFILDDISKAPFQELLLSNKQEAETFYRVRVRQTVLDEHKGKEVKKSVCYLVRAASTRHAEQVVAQAYSDSAVDYEVTSIVKTKIVDIIDCNN